MSDNFFTHWNYRVITDGVNHWVGEVFYDEAGDVAGYTDVDSNLLAIGDRDDDVEELKGTITAVSGALDRPVLEVPHREDRKPTFWMPITGGTEE